MRFWRGFGAVVVAVGLMLGVVGVADANEEPTRAAYEPIYGWRPGLPLYSQEKIGDRVTVYFGSFDTATMAGVGGGAAASAILSRVGLPPQIANLLAGSASAAARTVAYDNNMCATLEFSNYFGRVPGSRAYVRHC